MKHVAFATHAAGPAITADDALALAPLRARGITAAPLVWDAPIAQVRSFDAVVLRSCWDYHLKPARFLAWLDALERAGTPVFNPPAVARWNHDKHYLAQLAARGIPVPDTEFVPRGAAPSLRALLRARGFDEAVIKPAVSLSAYGTFRTRAGDDAAAQQGAFAALVERGAVLVQRFVKEVLSHGELSLVFFRGAFSHAVRKRAAAGDFRVQQDHGGTREPCAVDAAVIAHARELLRAAPAPLLYARVDLVERASSAPWLMELEALDPESFLRFDPAAAGRFASALADALRA